MNYFEILGTTLMGNLTSVPVLLAWLIGIILAAFMLRQGRSKAETLLLIGCCLMFVSQVSRPFLTAVGIYLAASPEVSNIQAASTVGALRLPLAVLDMAGIVSLLFAFWFRWKTRSTAAKQTAVSTNTANG